MPVQAHAGMGKHYGVNKLSVALAERSHPEGNIMDEGMAVTDK